MPMHNWKKTALLVLLAGGLGAFFALGGDEWLRLDTLVARRDTLLAFVNEHHWGAALAAVFIYTAAVALSVPGAVILSLAMGMLFGRWLGALLILIAATTGAALVFLAARYLFADAARERLRAGPAAKLIAGFHDDAFHYLLFLRLVPLFPFWLVNLAPAFTPITLRTFAAATALGILPGTFVFANLGQSLGHIAAPEQLLSRETLFAFALLGVFALIPVAVKKFRAAKHHSR